MSSTTEVGARASANGFVRRTHGMAPEEIAAGWSCKKRDGTVVPFDCGKVRKALYRCFNALNPDALASDVNGTEHLVEEITRKVVNSIAAQKETCPDVEEVQRLVIQQLWAEGLFDSAEHYQNYREEHRKARSTGPSPPRSPPASSKTRSTSRPTSSITSSWRSSPAGGRRRSAARRGGSAYERVMPWFQRLPWSGGKLTERRVA
jgi:hypothetical protein